MIRIPLIPLGVLAALLIAIALLRKASLEGKVILGFAALSVAAFMQLHFYLLLFTALALFAFVGVALVWAWLAAFRVSVERALKSEAVVGESVPITYRIRSRMFPSLYHVRVWDWAYKEHIRSKARRDTDKRRGFWEKAESFLVMIGLLYPLEENETVKFTKEIFLFEEPGYLSFLRICPREVSEGTQHVVPPVRGTIKFGPIAVEGGDPFGIFSLTRWITAPGECLVLPTWVRLRALPEISARLGTRQQEHAVSREGQSHEFLGTREWAEGDSLRRVHWPLTARHDKLIVRQFQREVAEEILIILDADSRADVGEGAENAFEYLVTLALSLAHTSTEMGRPWTLAIAGTDVEVISHTSKEPLLRAQYSLARLEASRMEPIEASLDEIRGEHPASGCALLTARTDPGPAAVLAEGDARAGQGARSLIIRVDPSTFSGGIDDGIRMLRQRREAPGPAMLDKAARGVPELTVSRGENLAELFTSHAPA